MEPETDAQSPPEPETFSIWISYGASHAAYLSPQQEIPLSPHPSIRTALAEAAKSRANA